MGHSRILKYHLDFVNFRYYIFYFIIIIYFFPPSSFRLSDVIVDCITASEVRLIPRNDISTLDEAVLRSVVMVAIFSVIRWKLRGSYQTCSTLSKIMSLVVRS